MAKKKARKSMASKPAKAGKKSKAKKVKKAKKSPGKSAARAKGKKASVAAKRKPAKKKAAAKRSPAPAKLSPSKAPAPMAPPAVRVAKKKPKAAPVVTDKVESETINPGNVEPEVGGVGDEDRDDAPEDGLPGR